MTDNTDKKGMFLQAWRILASDLPIPVSEYRFAAKSSYKRNWEFDWAWPEFRVAVEVDGGNSIVKRSKTGRMVAVGYHTQDGDYRKINAAQDLGWKVFRIKTSMLKARRGQIISPDAAEVVEQVRRALNK
jgi:very-short-patch-repair endonuclease